MSQLKHAAPIEPDPETCRFYVHALQKLDEAKIDYVVGGGYAMAYYTGIARNTKDLDIFIRPEDRDPCLRTLAQAGYRTEFFYPFWISKALHGEAFIDIIYNSANGLCPVDNAWFTHAQPVEVHGYPTRLVPPEEQLWSKAFVQDRDRYDGADVMHLILRQGSGWNWERLLRRFEKHERVFLSFLLLFGYVYPGERGIVPGWVIERLTRALADEPPTSPKICRGPFICQLGYLPDIHEWSYGDARILPGGPLTDKELSQLPTE